jgi:IPT/TIG domain
MVLGALALGAASAPALILHVGQRALSYQPVPPTRGLASPFTQPRQASSSPLEYHGGPVMTSNTNHPFYWDPAGGSEYPAGYQSGIDTWFEDLAHDSGGLQNTDSVLVQYKDSAGEHANYDSHYGGALIDTNPYPANGCFAAAVCLTDTQLTAELASYIEAHKLPTGLQHEYFILTPPGVESCVDAKEHVCSEGSEHPSYCAYHSYVNTTGGVVIYADDPYVNGLNCDYAEKGREQHPNGVADSAIGGGLAHEHSESATDPEINAWYDSRERESADKCRTFKEADEYGEPLGLAPDGAKYNQVINGDLYWYQQEWSNETGECEQREAVAPAIKKLKPKKGPLAGGTSVTITGSHFIAPATVDFGEAPGTNVTVVSPTTITVVSPASVIAGFVNVTVTTSAGTSVITKKTRFKYKNKKK